MAGRRQQRLSTSVWSRRMRQSKRRKSLFLEFSGKVTVVTGGAHGIGYAVAERLTQSGARVVVADRDEENGHAATERLNTDGGKAIAVRVDVTHPEEIHTMVERVLESYGRLDVLVNNAGINGRNAPLWETSDEEWEKIMVINLTSVFRCCRAVIGHMRERRSGAIVNVASISGKEGNSNQIPYSVSKAGTICLTKALAKEVIGDGIRVNAVAPALIE